MRHRAIGLILALLLAAASSASAAPVLPPGPPQAMSTMDDPISASEWIVPEVDVLSDVDALRAPTVVYREYRLAEQESFSIIPEPTTLLLLGLALAGLAAGRQMME